ncbi:MAG: bifunctional diaminohydroxyphosphoribosylaminopyrimidine deaminase/5-amino-6-(5-phosphoribosylamino)uracil reductase RibD [Paludibacteraceae bacterium]|nr:bifunctional diaminohydroxyphosphoribosylaminopyrimidine deaminase/5-amino-6-(5-phosphoribosylamino)uracil reductase RibD [Paludibacteraceae bacterium]
MDYAKYMRRCLQLARLGCYYVAPNPMVGAVLVRETPETGEEVLAEGWHERFGEGHAEVNCFRHAAEAGITDFTGCTLFVSLEPCSHYGKTPPCAKLIIEKGVRKVVVGTLDPNPQVAGNGVRMLREAGIEVVTGVEEAACRELNKRFLCLHEKHRPYVVLKWAQTADGYMDVVRDINDQSLRGKPLVISNSVTKQLVHQMRAENMAIMVGTRTALLDNPRLCTTRWSGRNPVRVVLDRHGVIPRDSKLFSVDAETLVYADTDYRHILSDLAARGIHSLMVEGGAQLLTTILESGIWDEIHLEVSPQQVGQGVKAPALSCPMEEIMCIENHKIYKNVR